MDLRLKAYLKATGIVLGCFGSVFLMVFVTNGIMGIDFMRENYQTIQNVLFKILIVCMLLMVIVYVISGIAESDIRGELQKLKSKEREEYEKQHKSDWQMNSVLILAIAIVCVSNDDSSLWALRK